MHEPATVSRQLVVEAPIERLFEMIATPGWYISDHAGDKTPQTIHPLADGHVLRDDRFGNFFIRVLEVVPPTRHVSTCTYSPLNADAVAASGPATTIVIDLEQRDDGVLVTVTETGFESMAATEDELRAMLDGNADGWEKGLRWLQDQAAHT